MTELKSFQVERPDGSYADPGSKAEALALIHTRTVAHRPGGYTLNRNHQPVQQGHEFTVPELDDFLAGDFSARDVGTLWTIHEVDGPFELKTRKVGLHVRDKDTTGNPGIDRLYAIALLLDLATGNAGIAVRKNIGSTSEPSQHNPWCDHTARGELLEAGANAIDTIGSLKQMDECSNHFAAHPDVPGTGYRVRNIIHWFVGEPYPKIWHEGTWSKYTVPAGGSDHKGHVHLDLDPPRGPDFQGPWDQPC